MIENNFNNILNEAKKLHQNGNLISAINKYLKLIDSHKELSIRIINPRYHHEKLKYFLYLGFFHF